MPGDRRAVGWHRAECRRGARREPGAGGGEKRARNSPDATGSRLHADRGGEQTVRRRTDWLALLRARHMVSASALKVTTSKIDLKSVRRRTHRKLKPSGFGPRPSRRNGERPGAIPTIGVRYAPHVGCNLAAIAHPWSPYVDELSVGPELLVTHPVWLAGSCSVAIKTADALVRLARAQVEAQHCTLICGPTFTFAPAFIRFRVDGRARIRSLSTGAVTGIPSTNNVELILGARAPTVIPRTSLIASFQWLPRDIESSNPFTEYAASELDAKVRDNTPSFTLGVSVNARQSAAPTANWEVRRISAVVRHVHATRAHSRTSSISD